MKKVDDLERELRLASETYEEKISKLFEQLKAKDNSVEDAWQMARDKEGEIAKYYKQARELEDMVKDLRKQQTNVADNNNKL